MGWKNILILAILFLVACGLFAFLEFNENGLKLVDAKQKEHEAVLAANREMEIENAEMARTIKRLKEDPFYVENVARQDYGLAGPDDIVFTFDKARTGKPVWPEERAADDARRAEEARKLKKEHEGASKPPEKKPPKSETAKNETKTREKDKNKPELKTSETKKAQAKHSDAKTSEAKDADTKKAEAKKTDTGKSENSKGGSKKKDAKKSEEKKSEKPENKKPQKKKEP